MAQSAPARTRKPTKNPTTSPLRGLPPRPGEGPARGAQPRLRERSRATGHPRRRQPGDRAGVRHHGLPRAGRPGPVARGLVRERQPAAVRGGVRGAAGCQAGEGHRAAGRRRAEHGAGRRRPDRALPRPRPPAGRPAVVPQARAHPAQAVRAVRCPGDRRRGLPGHQDMAHAAGRQRRAHRQGRRAGARDDLGPGRRGHRGRVPGQPAAGEGALAGRGPPAAGAAGERGRGIGTMGRSRRDPVRRRRGAAREGAGRRVAREAGPADGQHRGLQRAAVGRDRRPHRAPGGHGRPRHHRGPQGGGGRRAPVRRGTEEPQAAADHLPPPDPGRLPAGRAARRPHRAGRTEQGSGSNPLGLVFPSPHGKHWRSSNFNRNVLKRAYLEIGWRDADGKGSWTWHSLRHVFCTTALFTWKLDVTDVSRMAGHANYRITLDMYVGSTAGVLDRARRATE
jgi:hypothetical protein